MKKIKNNEICPVAKTLEIIGKKWTILIIRDLLKKPRRFNELHKTTGGANPRTLSLRLKELEKRGIIKKRIYPEVPPHTEYILTKKGFALSGVLEQMKKWGKKI